MSAVLPIYTFSILLVLVAAAVLIPAMPCVPRFIECSKFFKKAADTRAFGSVARKYNAWLRSGDVDGASYAYLLHSSGAHNRSNAYRYYAVRPASSNAVN